jgi:hypothetical protein
MFPYVSHDRAQRNAFECRAVGVGQPLPRLRWILCERSGETLWRLSRHRCVSAFERRSDSCAQVCRIDLGRFRDGPEIVEVFHAAIDEAERDDRPACGGAVRIIACIEDPDIIEKILTHLDAKGAESGATRRPPSRAPPQQGLFD